MAVDINTGITDLTTAVTALTLQASTFDATFNLRIGQLVSAIDNIPPGCECPTMGTGTPIGDVEEEDPPPEGYGTWDPGIDDRKCKLANMMYDDIYSVTQSLYDNDVQEVAGLGVGSLTALFGLIAAMLVSGPLSWGLAALGAIAGAIAFFLLQTVDLFQLLVIMLANQEDLVCELYESTSSQEALDGFKAVLTAGGASVPMLAYLDALQMLNGLVVLFFDPEGAMGEEINDRLDGFVSTIDCANCAEPSAEGCFFDTSENSPWNVITYGTFPPGWDNPGGDVYTTPALGWATTTVRTVGTYQVLQFYIANPVYGHPEWGNGANDVYWSTCKLYFEILNMATLPTVDSLGLGGRSGIVRGPGWSSNAYRASTAGSPPLASWEQMTLGLDPLREWIRIGLQMYYDANYQQPQPGNIYDIHFCSEDLPTPWE